MKRLPNGNIEITDVEAANIFNFITNQLDSDWDRHTDKFICTESWEEGRRRMDPDMYDFAKELQAL